MVHRISNTLIITLSTMAYHVQTFYSEENTFWYRTSIKFISAGCGKPLGNFHSENHLYHVFILPKNQLNSNNNKLIAHKL